MRVNGSAAALLALCAALSAPAVSAGEFSARAVDHDRRVLSWPVRKLERAGDRFVQFRIDTVTNPDGLEAAFQVHYRPCGSEPVYLGGFALFPPDRPGRFIVPTQGRVGQGGTIALTLEHTGEPSNADEFRIVVGDVRLIEQPDRDPAP